MPDLLPFFQCADDSDRLLEVSADEEGIEVRVYRPGATSTTYSVYLDADDVQQLQLALAAHLHAEAIRDGATP